MMVVCAAGTALFATPVGLDSVMQLRNVLDGLASLGNRVR